MPDGYSNHRDQYRAVSDDYSRKELIERALLDGLGKFVQYREVGFVVFGDMTVDDLARAFQHHPVLIKPILASVNIASRAIKRDLGVDFNLYSSRVTPERASQLAGYVYPLLPRDMAIPALVELDRSGWVDKEMRNLKARWEARVQEALVACAGLPFKKRHFDCEGEEYEIDAAHFDEDVHVHLAVDVKRIESPRDIHKRCDEIVNKALKLKRVLPAAKFYAVVYYPFPQEHGNIRSRLAGAAVDGVFFASETADSIRSAAMHLLAHARVGNP
ncbi:MAG: hypothetical protein FJ109_07235 [Deltaproteobacteria bacterium]|nr:hypothetical protein [Deltaproteobacteria bacterium]